MVDITHSQWSDKGYYVNLDNYGQVNHEVLNRYLSHLRGCSGGLVGSLVVKPGAGHDRPGGGGQGATAYSNIDIDPSLGTKIEKGFGLK